MDEAEEHHETHVDHDHFFDVNVFSCRGDDVDHQIMDIMLSIQDSEMEDLASFNKTNDGNKTPKVTYQFIDFKNSIITPHINFVVSFVYMIPIYIIFTDF